MTTEVNRLSCAPTLFTILFVAAGLSLVGCGSEKQELGSATEHFLAAQDAIAAGDQETALKELTTSIELGPDAWACYQRALIYRDKSDDEKALADCSAGLALDPEHVELKWLQGELKKPKGQRFLGRNREPPMNK